MLLGLRERVRDLGMPKAVGLTPGQVTGAYLAAQAVVAAAAALAGIVLGLGIFRLVIGLQGSDEWAYPRWWSLAVLAVTAPLARRAAAIRVTDALRYE